MVPSYDPLKSVKQVKAWDTNLYTKSNRPICERYATQTQISSHAKHIYAICTCTIVAGLLIWASYDLPLVGQLENPVHQNLAQDFIEGSRNHIGIPNVVTSILASYRGYDTFGETIVIYTAGIAVLVLLYDGVSKASKINKEKK